MKKFVLMLNLAVFWPASSALAQLEPPNEMGVTMGEFGLNVKDVEANKKFFAILGGTPLKIDGIDVMKFPGIFIFLKQGNPPVLTHLPTAPMQMLCGCPGDEFEPSIVNHVGFVVRDYDDFSAKIKAANVKTAGIPGGGRRQVLIFSPDNLVFEIGEDKSISTPIARAHIHAFAPESFPKGHEHQVPAFDMFRWYSRTFGAKLGDGAGPAPELPGMRMRVSITPLPTVPTKGRALDHLGFEVKNLEAFSKKLEASGVKFTQPYSKTRHADYASAELVDPWGVSIELTEGLSKF